VRRRKEEQKINNNKQNKKRKAEEEKRKEETEDDGPTGLEKRRTWGAIGVRDGDQNRGRALRKAQASRRETSAIAVYATTRELRWMEEIGDGAARVLIGEFKIGPLRASDAMAFELDDDGRIRRIARTCAPARDHALRAPGRPPGRPASGSDQACPSAHLSRGESRAN
jgi:hypothetical protein